MQENSAKAGHLLIRGVNPLPPRSLGRDHRPLPTFIARRRRTIGVLVGGQVVSTYEDESGEAVDLRLRLPDELRQDVRQVTELRLAVPGPAGVSLVPIADLVTVERTLSPSEITRQDMSRQVVPLGTAAKRSIEAPLMLREPRRHADCI